MVLPPDRRAKRARLSPPEPALAAPAKVAPLQTLERQATIEPAVQRHLLRAQAEHLANDHPERALALLDELGEGPSALRIGLLCSLGRGEEAARVLAEVRRLAGATSPAELGRISVEAARLAQRRNQPKEAHRLLQQGLRFAEQPEVRGQALVRLGVVELDRGHTAAGFQALREGHALLQGCGAVRLLGSARLEEGLYRLMLGEIELGRSLLEVAAADGLESGSVYLERVARSGLALALRLQGEGSRAEAERSHALSLETGRAEEPGVFALRALERRLAGDRRAAETELQQGLSRHACRPNPADAATLLTLAAAWEGKSARVLPKETPPFVRTLLHAARREPAGAKLAARIGQRLTDELVKGFRRW